MLLAAKRIALAYCVTGLLYSAAGYLHRAIVGKGEVFSPLIGVPMDVVGWPWMVYADLKHMGAIGLKPQPLVALLSAAAFVAAYVVSGLRLRERRKL